METLTNPETGEVVRASRNTAKALREEGWENQATADNVSVGDPEEVEAAGEEAEESDADEAPAKSATRGEWDEYARSKGIDPEEYSSKDDLIEAVEAA